MSYKYIATNIFLLFIFSNVLVHSQKYTILNGDTVVVEEKIYKVNGNDTLYTKPCNTFEIRNNEIINYQDKECNKEGVWYLYNEGMELHSKGNYKDNLKDGAWIYCQDIQLTDTIIKITYQDGYELQRVNYRENKVVETSTHDLTKLLFDKLWMPILIILLTLFYARVILNNQIYNKVEGTNKSLILNPFKLSNLVRFYKSMFTFYWSKRVFEKNPILKQKVKTSNNLSITIIILFVSFFLFAVLTNSTI